MNVVRILCLTYLALAVQTSLRGEFIAVEFTPNFLILACAAAVLTLGGWPAIAWAAAIGLVSDCSTPDPLGIDMAAATIAALAVQTLRQGRKSESLAVSMILMTLLIVTQSLTSVVLRLALLADASVETTALSTKLGITSDTLICGLVLLAAWRIVKRLLPARAKDDFNQVVNKWNMLTN